MPSRLNEKPRIAAVGIHRGSEAVKAWQGHGLASFVACCDLNRGLLEQECNRIAHEGLERPQEFDHVDKLIDWGKFDAVMIATPDATHYPIAKKFMEAGYNCYIEKPMTNSIEDAVRLVEIWKRTRVIAVAGHQLRYLSSVVFAKEKIETGAIGTPRLAVTIDSCGRMGDYWRRKQWRAGARDAANSLTLQKAIHHLDIQTYLMNSRARKVYASAGNDVYGGKKASELTCDQCIDRGECIYDYHTTRINGMDFPKRHHGCVFAEDADLKDNTVVTIDYENGSRGSYTECFFTPDCRSEHTIIGDKGQIVIREFTENPYLEVELSWIGKTTYERHSLPGVGGHGGADYRMGEVFAEALRENRQTSPDPIDGLCAVALAQAIDLSVETEMPQPVMKLAEVQKN